MPTSPTLRRSASALSDEEKLSAEARNENRPKMPSPHAPADMGSENLNTRIMLRNRNGTPRSAMRSNPQAATSGSDKRYPTVAVRRSRTLPKLSAMAAVKYAPPAMPPRKKYSTIIISQSGVLSMVTPVPPALAEGEERAEAHQDSGADGEQRVDDDVALRQLRIVGEVVRPRLRQEQEERVEAA